MRRAVILVGLLIAVLLPAAPAAACSLIRNPPPGAHCDNPGPRVPPTTSTSPPTTRVEPCVGRVVVVDDRSASDGDVGRCTTTTTTAAAPATTVAPATVEATQTTQVTAQTGEDALPFTGRSSVPTLVVGVLLLAVGALALAGTRRAPKH